MEKKSLVGIGICAVVLLLLSSFCNVAGYQTVQSSHQQTIKEAVNQRELLFQAICDITNNKEIQRIILKSQISNGIFPKSNIPVLTENQLKVMYFIGIIFSKMINKSRIQSIVDKYLFNNQDIQKEISAIVEKDTQLNREITQLSNSECDCEKEEPAVWHFPVLCILLWPVAIFFIVFMEYLVEYITNFIIFIGLTLTCFWAS